MIEKNTIMRLLVTIAFLIALYYASKTMCFNASDKIKDDVKCEYVNTSKSVVNYVSDNNLGEFMLTAYCSCVECCGKSDGITSTGVKAKQGRTIAVDPKVIPYGTKVVINGKTYVAEDCGGAIKNNHIDVFFNTHEEALEYGVKYENIYIMED